VGQRQCSALAEVSKVGEQMKRSPGLMVKQRSLRIGGEICPRVNPAPWRSEGWWHGERELVAWPLVFLGLISCENSHRQRKRMLWY
jgi:hypothetical protein